VQNAKRKVQNEGWTLSTPIFNRPIFVLKQPFMHESFFLMKNMAMIQVKFCTKVQHCRWTLSTPVIIASQTRRLVLSV